MNYQYNQLPFSKPMLTGVFVGFTVTIFCLIYNVIFRTSTGFLPADFINVSTLIFGLNLIFWVIGIAYALLLQRFQKADKIFEVVFLLLMAFLIWRVAIVQRWQDAHLNAQFKILLEGILIISAIGIGLIPLLYRHPKFTKYVL